MGYMYAVDAGIVLKSPEGLKRTTTVIVAVFETPGLTVSKKKTKAMEMRTLRLVARNTPLVKLKQLTKSKE